MKWALLIFHKPAVIDQPEIGAPASVLLRRVANLHASFGFNLARNRPGSDRRGGAR